MAKYVIDTNVVHDAFLNDDLRTDILKTGENLIAPTKLIDEILSQKGWIQLDGKLSSGGFEMIWKQLLSKIKIRKVDTSKVYEAERILRDLKKLGVGLEDKEFVGLVLYLRCPYWTLEKKYSQDPSISNALRKNGIVAVMQIF